MDDTKELDKLLSAAQVALRLELSPGTVRNLRCAKRLPEPVVLSPRCVRWRASEIQKIVSGETNIGPPIRREKRKSKENASAAR